eukprot:UN04858
MPLLMDYIHVSKNGVDIWSIEHEECNNMECYDRIDEHYCHSLILSYGCEGSVPDIGLVVEFCCFTCSHGCVEDHEDLTDSSDR